MLDRDLEEKSLELPIPIQWHEPGLSFDAEALVIQGIYVDELSAFRAKKVWSDCLSQYFLLETGVDYLLSIIGSSDGDRFMLRCSFTTACARYAFWRLINNQAPETQYILETAHIPICESRCDEILTAPDMKPISEAFLGKNSHPISAFDANRDPVQWDKLKQMVSKLITKLTKL